MTLVYILIAVATVGVLLYLTRKKEVNSSPVISKRVALRYFEWVTV